jgi:hypothetical protein
MARALPLRAAHLLPRPLLATFLAAACATDAAAPEGPASRSHQVRPADRPDAAATAPDAGSEGSSDARLSQAGDAAAATPPKRASDDESFFADVGTKHVSVADWLARAKQKISTRWKIDAGELRFSPAQTQAVFLLPPPGQQKSAGPRRARARPPAIVVVDFEARLRRRFIPVRRPRGDATPKDLSFLGEDRIVYEVALLAAPPTRSRSAAKAMRGAPSARAPAAAASLNGRPQGQPPRLFVIQPLRRGARPIRCQGSRFSFNPPRDHLAFTAGPPGAEFVAVDGARLYPRKRGHAAIASDLAWAKDQPALAFVERPEDAARLVLIADVGNASGDTTWDLPASAVRVDDLRVFWPDADKIVVGRSLGRPIFATTFSIERPR